MPTKSLRMTGYHYLDPVLYPHVDQRRLYFKAIYENKIFILLQNCQQIERKIIGSQKWICIIWQNG
ncbi:unnamed protein product [Paramecium octaurelia]|uniref:Uncharacterized protein n=1 Tax=Paramecium octaurelia TaxID=43137 RepID=A0A8S1Y276_PAROT|nr:unnamed protein product [Paramecium octaurelia]